MIVTIQARGPVQRCEQQFAAMIHGIPADPVGETFLDLTVRDTAQVLPIIRRAGGTVIAYTRIQPMTRAEAKR